MDDHRPHALLQQIQDSKCMPYSCSTTFDMRSARSCVRSKKFPRLENNGIARSLSFYLILQSSYLKFGKDSCLECSNSLHCASVGLVYLHRAQVVSPIGPILRPFHNRPFSLDSHYCVSNCRVLRYRGCVALLVTSSTALGPSL